MERPRIGGVERPCRGVDEPYSGDAVADASDGGGKRLQHAVE